MTHFENELNARLDRIRSDGLYRELRRVESPQGTRIKLGGDELLNFSSNDYLGLATNSALIAAAQRAAKDFGAGSGASRLLCGSIAPHHELEAAIAAFKQMPAALTFSTGFATAIGTIGALIGSDDVVILDKLVHASIVDAARLSGAKLRVFRHNDLDELESMLKWADDLRKGVTKGCSVLVVTESVFSMDGDTAPLTAMVELKDRYGAWLMVDEAHATGVMGPGGRGLAAELGISERIEIQMGTLGKALGAAGGYICGSRALIDYLVNRARSFIFSTAPVPASAAAATAGIRIAASDVGDRLRAALHARIEQFVKVVNHDIEGRLTPIIPILLGAETDAVAHSQALRERGLFVPAIRYPTVSRGRARLRVTLTASHKQEEVQHLISELQRTGAINNPCTH